MQIIVIVLFCVVTFSTNFGMECDDAMNLEEPSVLFELGKREREEEQFVQDKKHKPIVGNKGNIAHMILANANPQKEPSASNKPSKRKREKKSFKHDKKHKSAKIPDDQYIEPEIIREDPLVERIIAYSQRGRAYYVWLIKGNLTFH